MILIIMEISVWTCVKCEGRCELQLYMRCDVFRIHVYPYTEPSTVCTFIYVIT